MNDGGCRCTCENDGYIDWVMRRIDKRPGLLQPKEPKIQRPGLPHPSQRDREKEQLPVAAARANQLPREPGYAPTRGVSRRGFLSSAALGAGGFLAWQGGLKPSAAQACGGLEGDWTWDWTWWQGTGYFLNRREWGARAPRVPVTVLNQTPRYVIVHHTATANTTNLSQAHAISLSRSIQNYHMDSNGWIDAGQHFTLSRGNYLCEGRARSIEIELLACYNSHVRGTHVANYNDVCIGIENEGTYTSVLPSDAMIWYIISSVATCCFYNSIPSWNIKGHRDFNATQCPGDRLYAILPYIRSWVAYLLEGGPYPG